MLFLNIPQSNKVSETQTIKKDYENNNNYYYSKQL